MERTFPFLDAHCLRLEIKERKTKNIEPSHGALFERGDPHCLHLKIREHLTKNKTGSPGARLESEEHTTRKDVTRTGAGALLTCGD